MPQFDFTTYSAQIFWFSLCFLTLYFFMASVILPRIKDIISERKKVINDDLSAAAALNESIGEARIKAENILFEANAKYKTALDEAAKTASKNREKAAEEFKQTSQKLLKNSQAEIGKMVESSKDRSEKLISQVAELTQNKIYN